MVDNTIRIECKGAVELSYQHLTPLQGNLKELHDADFLRLKKEILELGFSFPECVWQFEGKNYIIDGHQRVRVISHMVEKEGYSCPPLPCALVFAKDEEEAAHKLLAGASVYGTPTGQGLYEFMAKFNIGPSELDMSFKIPGINSESFKAEYFEGSSGEIKVGDTETEDSFAEGEQFGSMDRIIEIKVSDKMLNESDFKDSLYKFCENYGVVFSIK